MSQSMNIKNALILHGQFEKFMVQFSGMLGTLRSIKEHPGKTILEDDYINTSIKIHNDVTGRFSGNHTNLKIENEEDVQRFVECAIRYAAEEFGIIERLERV